MDRHAAAYQRTACRKGVWVWGVGGGLTFLHHLIRSNSILYSKFVYI